MGHFAVKRRFCVDRVKLEADEMPHFGQINGDKITVAILTRKTAWKEITKLPEIKIEQCANKNQAKKYQTLIRIRNICVFKVYKMLKTSRLFTEKYDGHRLFGGSSIT